MPNITPFQSIRPRPDVADQVAALPYDVYNRKEACNIVADNPLSFLKIDRAETQFPDSVHTYDDRVYLKAKELLDSMIEDGTFIMEDAPCYYIYELTMDGRSQTGLVACSSIDDYQNNIIKKHENTREDKELDRICHVDITNAQTGPIFLVYRTHFELSSIISVCKQEKAIYNFTSDDGISHRVWIINDESKIKEIGAAFHTIPCTYIADGHHRCASAVKVGLKRRKENPNHTGSEEYNRFLSVLFPQNELHIMPYNRVIKDYNGLTKDELLDKIEKQGFEVTHKGNHPVAPMEKGSIGMYLSDDWYLLQCRQLPQTGNPVEDLDVSLLQDQILAPILGIEDPRTDSRIDFVGGIRGLKELERRVKEDMAIAFSMYPTSIEELLDVSDAGLLMPPKSTWFEPKLRSGLFIHRLS